MDKILLDRLWTELVRERIGEVAVSRAIERAEARERVADEKAAYFDGVVRIMRSVIRRGWWWPGDHT